MNTTTEESTCTPPHPETQEPPAGVIARPSRHNEGWSGRYLHHVPGPSETARLIRKTVTARSTARTRMSTGVSELIDAHPCGWERLGVPTAKDPEIKARRRPAAAGSCYCHTPDGQIQPELLTALLGMLHHSEQALHTHNAEALKRAMPHSLTPTDSIPQLISPHAGLPARVAYLFLLRAEGITVGVRDGAHSLRYLEAGEVCWSGEADWEQIDATAAAIRARVPEDLARDNARRILARTARELREIAHGQYASDRVHWHTRSALETTLTHDALARAAAIGVDELNEHLNGTSLESQADLFDAAARQLPDGCYRAT